MQSVLSSLADLEVYEGAVNLLDNALPWLLSKLKLLTDFSLTLMSSVVLYILNIVEYITEQPSFKAIFELKVIGSTTLIVIFTCSLLLTLCVVLQKCKSKDVDDQENHTELESLSNKWSVYDLAKRAYEPGHTQAVMAIVERLNCDVNTPLPGNGLTLFLCACLSGQKELILYLIQKGADVRVTTKEGDTSLYLATFGVLASSCPDTSILELLIKRGCDVNACNISGYTPLHRAGATGNMEVIFTLLKQGANPHQASASGIYPMDCAVNAGHLEAADMLKIEVTDNYHMWDVLDPHTPPRIRLGLQSPQRKHLLESSRPHLKNLKTI